MTRIAVPSVLVALLCALVLAPSAVAGGVQSSNIDTPVDGFHFYDDQSSGTAFTVHGTATNISTSVDIKCYASDGSVITLASAVPLSPSGEFSRAITGTDAYSGFPFVCVLRAVPHGDSTAHPPGDPNDLYQGPRLAESWNNDEQFPADGFDYFNTGFAGQLEIDPAGSFALDSSQLFEGNGDSNVQSEQLFEGNGYLASGTQMLDAQAVDLASSDRGSPGVPPISVSRSFDTATGALTITDREALVECADGGCGSYVPAGVELDRTWKTGDDGLTVSQTDAWRSTDGASHQLDADYAQGFNTNSATGSFLFPGTSSFQHHAGNDSVPLPHGPATVFVKEDKDTPDAGDTTHPQGAVTYANAPDSPAVFTQVTPTYSEWDSHYIRTIPASGAVTLRFAYAQAFALSDVQAFAQEQTAAFAPSLAIGSPADGSTSTTPNVTVSGTASDDAGISSLTVNGHSATVQAGGSWSVPLTLAVGPNTLTAVATDADGISSQRQITVSYAPPSPPPPPPPPPPSNPVAHLSLRGGVHALSNGVRFKLSCSAATCSGTATLSATELLSRHGGKLLGVAVHKRRKTVTVGRVSFSLHAGTTKTITVKLNSRGRKLLRRFRRLPVKLSVRLAHPGGKATTVATRKLKIKAKKKKH